MPKRPPQNDEEVGPTRTCLVTRTKKDRSGMIRFVLSPDNEVVADIRNRLPGRGVWITGERDTILQATRRKAFDRGFRTPAKVSGDLADQVDALLEEDALQMLSLANKAGVVVTGFGKVEAALAGGEAGIVLHAADASADGVRKLGQAANRAGRTVERVNLFGSDRLGLALGRPHVIHAALKAGAPGAAFLAKSERLRAFRGHTFEQNDGQGSGFGTDE